MREGDDPREIYWRKSTFLDQLVLRERSRESRPDVEIVLEVRRPLPSGEDWSQQFERRIREVASRAIAHLKRGDGVTILTTAGERVRADHTIGADRLLRFLALVEALDLAPPGHERRASKEGSAVKSSRTVRPPRPPLTPVKP
jgi:uncharacterized protein (DUF58 family)